MWIATNKGFLSIVAADPTRLPKADKKRLANAVPLCVRARNAEHLRAIFPGFTVYEWKGRDYPARIFIGQEELGLLVAGLVCSIRYPNFKNSVADVPLHDAYMGVWSVMHRYQLGGFDRPRFDQRQGSFYGRFVDEDEPGWKDLQIVDDDQRPFNEQFPDDDEFVPCSTPGCTETDPCMNCMMDALRDEEGERDEDRYGPYDSGDDRDDDDGAESHRRIAP